jgi:hypothetical protein
MPSATQHDRHQAACSAGLRRPRAQLGPWAARGPRRSCTALYEAAPPAVGPTGTTGRARASYASTRVHLGTAGRGTLWERAASGPEELRDSDSVRTYASTHVYLCTTGRGTRKGPWVASGPEELRDSERSHGCRRDTVTVCFQYPAPEVTVMVT